MDIYETLVVIGIAFCGLVVVFFLACCVVAGKADGGKNK